ncbi:MAG: radical SAM protein [Desulfobacterales bacterium]
MVDILLIQPPIRDFYLTAKRTIPYGLTSIAAVLQEAGYSVAILDGLATSRSKILDLPPEMVSLKRYYGKPDISPFSLFHHFRHFGYSFQHIGHMAKESGAFLVGISSLFSAYRNEAIQAAEIVKKYHPTCRIVLGGHHPTALPADVLQNKAVDFVLRGEGEVSLPVLADALRADECLDNIPGIAFRRPDGTHHISEPAVMADIDEYPPPAISLIKHTYYRRHRKGSAVIVTSRGCPMRCSYCCMGASTYLPHRQRRVESVMAEIETAVTRYDTGFIDFEDENLTLDKAWFLKLLDRFITRHGNAGIELRAMNGLFPPSLDNELIAAMKTAGFKTLNLSLGSTSGEQLRRFNRPDVRQSLSDVLALAKDHGLDAVVYVIAAAPGQRADDSIRDLLFLAENNVLGGISIFYPAPGSADYALCESLGILPEHLSLMRSSALPLSHSTTRREAVTLLRLGRIVNFMKSLTDQGETLPKPAPPEPIHAKALSRKEMGIHLLQGFFHDGRIRGMTPEGDIYEHEISRRLTSQFIAGLSRI